MPCRVPRRCRLQCGVRSEVSSQCGEDLACCYSLGKFGLASCDENRYIMMTVSWLLAFLQFLLSLCSLAAVGTQKHSVMNLAWTVGRSDTQQLYVGLEGLVINTEESSATVVLFTDSACVSDYCDQCHSSSSMTVFLVAICFLLSIPPLLINYKRASRKRDQNKQKFWGMVIPLFGLVACVVALTNFLNGCYYYLPQADDLHANIAWVVGPGAVCLLFSLLLKPLDVILHMVLPVVKEDEALLDETTESSFHL